MQQVLYKNQTTTVLLFQVCQPGKPKTLPEETCLEKDHLVALLLSNTLKNVTTATMVPKPGICSGFIFDCRHRGGI
jgi:hypothetical protein